MGCDCTSLFCYSQPHRSLIYHWPLALPASVQKRLQVLLLQHRRCSTSVGCGSRCPSERSSSVCFSALHQCGLGGELIAELKPPICEDFRPEHEELVLDLKLLQKALSFQALPGIALRHGLNTFSALSLPIFCSCFDGFVWKEIQIK